MTPGRVHAAVGTVISTTWGWSAVAANGSGVTHVVLPVSTRTAAAKALGAHTPVELDDPRLYGAGRAIEAYFGARMPDLDAIPIDLDLGTPFARLVWDVARRIPYGERRHYGWIAEELGVPQASRAVGAALGRNPVPLLVPCHRVVARNGSLRGFTGGIDLKAALLNLEAESAAA